MKKIFFSFLVTIFFAPLGASAQNSDNHTNHDEVKGIEQNKAPTTHSTTATPIKYHYTGDHKIYSENSKNRASMRKSKGKHHHHEKEPKPEQQEQAVNDKQQNRPVMNHKIYDNLYGNYNGNDSNIRALIDAENQRHINQLTVIFSIDQINSIANEDQLHQNNVDAENQRHNNSAIAESQRHIDILSDSSMNVVDEDSEEQYHQDNVSIEDQRHQNNIIVENQRHGNVLSTIITANQIQIYTQENILYHTSIDKIRNGR